MKTSLPTVTQSNPENSQAPGVDAEGPRGAWVSAAGPIAAPHTGLVRLGRGFALGLREF